MAQICVRMKENLGLNVLAPLVSYLKYDSYLLKYDFHKSIWLQMRFKLLKYESLKIVFLLRGVIVSNLLFW